MKWKFSQNDAMHREGDDSSDEDDPGLDLSTILLDLEKSWTSFKKEKLPRLLRLFQHLAINPASRLHEYYFRSSFILHFLGRALLNERRVKRRYRKEKHEKMPKTLVKKHPNFETVKIIIKKAILSLSTDFETGQLTTASGLLRKRLNSFINKNDQLINKIVNDLFKKDRILLKILNRPEFLLHLDSFENLLTILSKKKWMEDNEFKSNKKFTPSKFAKLAEKDKTILEDGLQILIIDEITEIFLENPKDDDTEMQRVLKQLNDMEHLSNFQKALKDKLIEIEEEEKISLSDYSVQNFVEDNLNLLLTAKKKDVFEEEKNRDEDRILWHLIHMHYMPDSITKKIINEMHLDALLIGEHIECEIKRGDIQKFISREMAKVILLERDTLNTHHVFRNNDKLNLLANLTLSNRSQRRLIRNKKLPSGKQGNIHTTSWELGKKIIEEQHEIVPPSFSRRDEVDPLTGANSQTKVGSYPQIYENIKILKKNNTQLTSENFAYYLQLLHTGKDISFRDDAKDAYTQFSSTLTYLLMGAEPVRSPASLLLHPIGLDLISSNRLTFQEVFAKTQLIDSKSKPISYGGGRFPMTMRSAEDGKKGSDPGAVASARWLHKQYNKFMPADYSYEGDEQPENEKGLKHILEMVKREHELLQFWFPESDDIRKLSVKDIATELLSSIFYEWYPDFISTIHTFSQTSSSKQRFEEQAMPLDGNCLFHAILAGYNHLRAQPDWKEDKNILLSNANELRKLIANFMENRLESSPDQKSEMIRRILNVAATDQYKNYVDNILNFETLDYDSQGNLDMESPGISTAVENYLHWLQQDGTYGGDLEILSACELLNISIACYQYDENGILQRTIIGKPAHPRISLLYKLDLAHYQLLLPTTNPSSFISTEAKEAKTSSTINLFGKERNAPLELLRKNFTPKEKSKNILEGMANSLEKDYKAFRQSIVSKLKEPNIVLLIPDVLSLFKPKKELLNVKNPSCIFSQNYKKTLTQKYLADLTEKFESKIPELSPADIEFISRIMEIKLTLHFNKNNILQTFIYNNIADEKSTTSLKKADLYVDEAGNYQGLVPKKFHLTMRSIFKV